jgi:alpha,alpha-trehalase
LQYDCRYGAGVGGGGEYTVQLGFGWTNGALLHIMETLPHLWSQEEKTVEETHN